jgi:hypothetical protein
MRSKVAEENRRALFARFAAMTPDERVALARRLGEQGIAAYMETHGVDRHTAIARIKSTRRLGRRPSSAADAD